MGSCSLPREFDLCQRSKKRGLACDDCIICVHVLVALLYRMTG